MPCPKGAIRKGWTPAEDATLLRMVEQDKGWTTIAQALPGRRDDSVRTRYKRLMREAQGGKKLTKQVMSDEEVQAMREEVASRGFKWDEVAKAVERRTGVARTAQAVRRRWQRLPKVGESDSRASDVEDVDEPGDGSDVLTAFEELPAGLMGDL